MNEIIFIVVALLVGTAIEHYVHLIIRDKNPPRTIKDAELTEVAFAVVLILAGLVSYWEGNFPLSISLFLIGIAWFPVALALYCGKKWARLLCIVMSVLRIPTCFGALFSLLCVCYLLVPKDSKDYFNQNDDHQKTDNNIEVT